MELYAIFDSDKGRARYHRMLDEIAESGRKPADIYELQAMKEVLTYLADKGFVIGNAFRKRYMVDSFK